MPHFGISWVNQYVSQADRVAYQALVVEGGMKKGDNVLIHAVRPSCLCLDDCT